MTATVGVAHLQVCCDSNTSIKKPGVSQATKELPMNQYEAFHDQRKVIIYARYSSDLQNPTSVVDQIASCRKEAETKNWIVIGERFDEGITGSRGDRPGYQALLEDLNAERCDVVLFESLDRLSRDPEHTAHFFKVATHHEAELYALDSGFIDAIRLGFSSTMAAAFLQGLAFKTRRGLNAKVNAGQSAGGISYGYRRGSEPGTVETVEDEVVIIRRIFQEYASGKSPLKIAAALNDDLIPSPATKTKRKTSGHWKQNTINGNPARGTGILNNELYIGRRVWNRLRYSKDPITGRRVSRLNSPEKLTVMDVPELRIIDQGLWNAVKDRQAVMSKERGSKEEGSTLATTRSNKRRKYLLSGLIRCGLCNGSMTIAGGNPKAGKRRYYCANAREKGQSICSGMPGILQTDVEEVTLSVLKTGLMRDPDYAAFKADFERHIREMAPVVSEDLQLRDKMIADHETTKANLVHAVERGEYSDTLVKRLNQVDAELQQMIAQRAAATPVPVELPNDIPTLYRDHIDDLVAVLSTSSVVDRAATELREMISSVSIHPRPEGGHRIELEGKLLEMLKKVKPAGEAGFSSNENSFQLVAGARFGHCFRELHQTRIYR